MPAKQKPHIQTHWSSSPPACFDDHFDTVALDFIGPLPEGHGKDTILTLTDLLGADLHITATHSTYTAAQVAVILFNEWYCENGLMLHLISNWDLLFTAELWTTLHKLTSVKLRMSTSYHPEKDGSSEQTNKTVNQAIRYHVDNNQKGWLAKLPQIQFAIMNTVNTSTGFSGFQLKTGWSPQVIPPLIPLSANATAKQTTAHKIITCVTLDIKEAQDNLLAAKICQAYHANEHHAPEDIYEVGDLVMLSTKNRHCNYKCKGKTHIAKFMPWNNGPYTITHAFPEHSEYTLKPHTIVTLTYIVWTGPWCI